MRVACLVLVWAPSGPKVHEIGCVGLPESLLGGPVPQGVRGGSDWRLWRVCNSEVELGFLVDFISLSYKLILVFN